MGKYITRRRGQAVATHDNIQTAFEQKITGDHVFRVIETHGEFGCITEHEVVLHGLGYAYKITVPNMVHGCGWTVHFGDDYQHAPFYE